MTVSIPSFFVKNCRKKTHLEGVKNNYYIYRENSNIDPEGSGVKEYYCVAHDGHARIQW